jgi:ADP-heptose:LPS heptosyltransferase
VAERFLLVKLADLGDVLTVTPALRALRLRYPRARIDALVTPAGAAALRGLDSVDDLLTFEKPRLDRRRLPGSVLAALRLGVRLRAARYDRIFLCHHLFTRAGRLKYAALLTATGAPWRGGMAERQPPFLSVVASEPGYGVCPEADCWLAVVGLAGARHPRPRLELALDAGARRQAAALLGPTRPRWRIALYPGSGGYSLARRWPAAAYADLGCRLLDALGREAVEIVVVGSANERSVAEAIAAAIGPGARSLAGATPEVAGLGAVLAECDLFIGNDGGVMHVAVAVETAVLAIFGPSNHVSWGPYRPATAANGAAPTGVVRLDLPCAPCLYRGHLPGTPAGCRTRDCLTRLAPEQVLDEALSLLQVSGDHHRRYASH